MKKKWLALFIVPTLLLGAAPMPQHASAASTAQIVASVSLRQSPDVNSTRIRYLGKGEQITILEKVNNWWYKVRDSNGRIGYTSTSNQYINTGRSTNTDGSSSSGSGLSASSKAQKVIDAGMKYLGTPYEYASDRSNTSTFDCSDFVRQAFLDSLHVTLPSDSRKQAELVRSIGHTTTDWHRLKVGDLMFFMGYLGPSASSYSGIDKSSQRISHVAIYLGNGKILHTYSKASGGVRIDTIEGSHWEDRFIFGGTAI